MVSPEESEQAARVVKGPDAAKALLQPDYQFAPHGVGDGETFQNCPAEVVEARKDGDRQYAAQSEDCEGLGGMGQPSRLSLQRQQYQRADGYQRNCIRHALGKSCSQYIGLAEPGAGADHEGAHQFTGACGEEIVSEVSRRGGPKREAGSDVGFGTQQNSPAHGAEEKRCRGEGAAADQVGGLCTGDQDPDLMPIDSPQRVIQECGGEQDSESRRDRPRCGYPPGRDLRRRAAGHDALEETAVGGVDVERGSAGSIGGHFLISDDTAGNMPSGSKELAGPPGGGAGSIYRSASA